MRGNEHTTTCIVTNEPTADAFAIRVISYNIYSVSINLDVLTQYWSFN